MNKIEELFQEVHSNKVIDSDRYSIYTVLERLNEFYYKNNPDVQGNDLPTFEIENLPMKRGTPQARLIMR